jgi:hypothetical protein
MADDFTFIIATRNPRTHRLVVINNDDENVAEFSCESAAIHAAENTTICKAWGYEIIEVGAPTRI